MSEVLELGGLQGTNPLGFLAAVGVLDVLTRAGRSATLAFADDLVPVALVDGADDIDDLVTVLDRDRATWVDSVVLLGPRTHPLDDAKPDAETAAAWAKEVADTVVVGRAAADLFCSLVAEGAVDGTGKGKPSHLHFTAGPQRFLMMTRSLVEGVGAERLLEALVGPWRDDSVLPSLSWDNRGGRPYALRATDPSKIKRSSVPGADWLALLGLAALPVRAVANRFPPRRGGRRPRRRAALPVRAVANRFTGNLALETTACDPRAFRWPLWMAPIGMSVVRSLLSDPAIVGAEPQRRATRTGPPLADILTARGVLRVLEAPIRRTDQGGYGSFGGAVTLVQARAAT